MPAQPEHPKYSDRRLPLHLHTCRKELLRTSRTHPNFPIIRSSSGIKILLEGQARLRQGRIIRTRGPLVGHSQPQDQVRFRPIHVLRVGEEQGREGKKNGWPGRSFYKLQIGETKLYNDKYEELRTSLVLGRSCQFPLLNRKLTEITGIDHIRSGAECLE